MRGVSLTTGVTAMNSKRKKMKVSWEENVLKYPNRIGMTGRRPEEDEFEAIVKDLKSKFNLKATPCGSILDVGCNNGYLLQCLDPMMPVKVGFDFCFSALKAGQNRYKDIKFVQGEISELPFPSNHFERVLCYNMYHYLPSVEAGFIAADELFRVLKHEGQLLIGDIFTEEHRHLIPREDQVKWNSPSRPFLHRMENWMFLPIERLKKYLEAQGAEVNILAQYGDIRCPGYRFDLLVIKKSRINS
jgi:ubiquinone/menaquinone biosynthesis C-methylase UbiE